MFCGTLMLLFNDIFLFCTYLKIRFFIFLYLKVQLVILYLVKKRFDRIYFERTGHCAVRRFVRLGTAQPPVFRATTQGEFRIQIVQYFCGYCKFIQCDNVIYGVSNIFISQMTVLSCLEAFVSLHKYHISNNKHSLFRTNILIPIFTAFLLISSVYLLFLRL